MRMLEVHAKVDGVVQVGSHTDLLVENSKGCFFNMRADNPPEWLTSGSDARLLVRVYRKSPKSQIEMRLLGAAPQQAIAAIEKQEEAS